MKEEPDEATCEAVALRSKVHAGISRSDAEKRLESIARTVIEETEAGLPGPELNRLRPPTFQAHTRVCFSLPSRFVLAISPIPFESPCWEKNELARAASESPLWS